VSNSDGAVGRAEAQRQLTSNAGYSLRWSSMTSAGLRAQPRCGLEWAIRSLRRSSWSVVQPWSASVGT
jgi:hypothetical protein